jgi:hypothetical protein
MAKKKSLLIEQKEFEGCGVVMFGGREIAYIPTELIVDEGVSDLAVRVFTFCQWIGGNSGECSTSWKTMAEYLSKTEQEIASAVDELVKADWAIVEFIGGSRCVSVFPNKDRCSDYRKEVEA